MSENKIKVSVIVPVYNVERYLKECIESIRRQSLTAIEIICIDDGSTDSSGRILDDYKGLDDRIIVIHKENSGYGNTMNMGIKHAKGKYISIIESDDYIEKNMLEEMVSIADCKQLDFIKASYWNVNGGEKTYVDVFNSCACDCVFRRMENMNKYFLPKSIWAGLYKRDFLIENNLLFLETPGASYQDTSFWFKICVMAQRGYFIKTPYVNYRIDNPTSSIHSNSKIYCVCDEIKECRSFLKRTNKETTEIWNYYLRNMFNTYLWNIKRLKGNFQIQLSFVKSISKEIMEIENKDNLNLFNVFDKKCIHAMIYSPEEYLKYINEEFTLITCMQNTEEERHILQYDEVYIYGAGKWGKTIGEFIIKKRPSIKINYITSDDLSEREINNKIPVFICNKSMVDRFDMYILAIKSGFKNITIILR